MKTIQWFLGWIQNKEEKNTKYIYLMNIKLTTAKCIFRTHIG